MSSKPTLRLDWCSHQAAKYAVEHWHYSRTMPAGKNVYVGAWESAKFIGAVIFGMGSGNATNGTRFGLVRTGQMAELTRVALTEHKTPVSRIVAISLRMLRSQSPGLRLVISMADPKQGHHGGIYQAGGWVYTGTTKPDVQYFSLDAAMREQISPLAKPYPKRPRAGSVDGDTSTFHEEEGGSIPTPALHEAAD